MDVSLVLTHRCNLACTYCYAGEHHKTDMDDDVLARGVELLFADDAEKVQLGFFGGEPFLAFEAMRRAIWMAKRQAEARGRGLVLQCTTNGAALKDEHLRFAREEGLCLTVSVDGVREAHDLHRKLAGGGPSYDQVIRGLKSALAAGVTCDAMMVITPETASYVYLSVNALWSRGVRTVRANVALNRQWTDEARAELREQLVSVGWELLARRLQGEHVTFHPFEPGMRSRRLDAWTGLEEATRNRVVVATSGNLYPCAPMVGADFDDGPEAALRMGHLDDGPVAILDRVSGRGVKCEKGKGCECASYLETGSRQTPGSMGRWYGLVCRAIGETLAEELEKAEHAPPPRKSKRRGFLIGLAAVVGGAMVSAPLLLGAFEEPRAPRPHARPRPCRLGGGDDDVAVGGATAMPPEPAKPTELPPTPTPPDPDYEVDGDIAAPPEPPPPPPTPMVRGQLAAPPEPTPPASVLGELSDL